MKTAISVPDSVFAQVEHHARRLGLSRSQFFAQAAARWATELEGEELTAAIDAALEAAEVDGADENDEFLRVAAVRTFARLAEHEEGRDTLG
ncbi:MAG: ribbon-helix-helix protein, CopG family [Actinomycetota bacterium]|nr:ribbon-helix-helix protein, CopG family [Actinomycetota bacterium]